MIQWTRALKQNSRVLEHFLNDVTNVCLVFKIAPSKTKSVQLMSNRMEFNQQGDSCVYSQESFSLMGNAIWEFSTWGASEYISRTAALCLRTRALGLSHYSAWSSPRGQRQQGRGHSSASPLRPRTELPRVTKQGRIVLCEKGQSLKREKALAPTLGKQTETGTLSLCEEGLLFIC